MVTNNELDAERIEAIWNGLDGKRVISGENQLNWNAALRQAFAHAIEQEVLARRSTSGSDGDALYRAWHKVGADVAGLNFADFITALEASGSDGTAAAGAGGLTMEEARDKAWSDSSKAINGQFGVNWVAPMPKPFAEWFAAGWNAKPTATSGGELAPVEHDKEMDRWYVPLPGGWEVQTKGKGSSFRLAHAPSGRRWIVTDDRLHDPLVALANAVRAAMSASQGKTEEAK